MKMTKKKASLAHCSTIFMVTPLFSGGILDNLVLQMPTFPSHVPYTML